MLAIGGLIGLAIWHLVVTELPLYLADAHPEAALWLDPGQPLALTTLADRALNGEAERSEPDSDAGSGAGRDPLGKWAAAGLRPDGKPARPPLSDQDRARIRMMAETAAARDPLNATALRILGQLADDAGDKALAERYMRASVHLSARSSYAVYWLMAASAKANNFADAMHYADLLLRKRPQLGRVAFPILMDAAERDPVAGQAALVALLATEPPWRPSFMRSMHQYVRDARAPLSVLSALKASSSPPSPEELNGYLNFLVARKLYEFAYYVWLQFLPADELADAAFLVNGSFEDPPSGSPFDWRIDGGQGVTIDVAHRVDTDGDHALYLELGPGRAQFYGVSQLVLLAPGRYRLSGRLQGDVSGRRGMQWRVTCIASGKVAGESPMFLGSAPTWTAFDGEFEVPADNCRAQQVRLMLSARSASEELASGAIWYDAMKIARIEPTGP